MTDENTQPDAPAKAAAAAPAPGPDKASDKAAAEKPAPARPKQAAATPEAGGPAATQKPAQPKPAAEAPPAQKPAAQKPAQKPAQPRAGGGGGGGGGGGQRGGAAVAKAEPVKRGEVVALPGKALSQAPRRAAPRKRHYLAIVSFMLAVVAPSAAGFAYLYGYAADQYASRVSFSVRSSENAAPIEFLGALTQTAGAAGADAEIIYEFVRSQQMVEAALAALPLRTYYNLPQEDVVFRLGEDRPIEDVLDYWNWMTDVSFDSGSGIVDFEARAFAPEDARAVTQFVLEESTRIVNHLSEAARNDAVRVAEGVLEKAENRLRAVRREIRAFRDVERALDPAEDARSSLELIAGLERELAAAQIELDTQRNLVGGRAAQIPYLQQRIASLAARIEVERARMGEGLDPESGETRAFSDLVAQYEELAVDREFAQNAYVSALAAYEQAQVEARRQTRYLAPHIRPTLSVEPQYPQRLLLGLALTVVALVSWAVVLLIVYNVRDRH